MGVHWEDGLFREVADPGRCAARAASFGKKRLKTAPRGCCTFAQWNQNPRLKPLHILACKLTTDLARSTAFDSSGVGAWFRERAARACFSNAIPIKAC
jgi:hypothetical protein